MKNLKNIIAALTLAATLSLTATVANAGLLLSDFRADDSQCKVQVDNTQSLATGLLLSDFASLGGLLLSDFASTGCQNYENTGILMAD